MKVVCDNFINEYSSKVPGFSIVRVSVYNTGYILDMRLVILGIGIDILLYYKDR